MLLLQQRQFVWLPRISGQWRVQALHEPDHGEINLVDTQGVEPYLSECKTDAFPIKLAAHCLAQTEGIEPPTRSFSDSRSTD